MDAGNYKAACPKLAESYDQDPATGTLLALALCREQAGQTASAWATYADVAARAKREGQLEREQAAKERIAALEPQLSRLTIAVAPETASLAGVVVRRDGEAVGKGAWGAPVALDPGEHVIEVTAPGKRAWTATLTIGPDADAQTVEVPPLEDTPAEAGSAPPAVGSGGEAREPAAETGPPLRTIGLIVGGAGVIGLGVGSFFGLRAQSLNDESNEPGRCDEQNQCDPLGGEKRDEADSAATVSTIAFIAGGALAAAGVTLFILGGSNDAGARAGIRATPTVGLGAAGLTLQGQF
jgi:serine/threonine-protein kinase